jgi:hypothetical protein
MELSLSSGNRHQVASVPLTSGRLDTRCAAVTVCLPPHAPLEVARTRSEGSSPTYSHVTSACTRFCPEAPDYPYHVDPL